MLRCVGNNCIQSVLHIAYGIAGWLFNTLFSSQDGDQQQRGPSSEPKPQDASEVSQDHAQASREAAAVGTHASGADGTAEAGSADAADAADGSAKYTSRDDQTGYDWPSNRPATHTGFVPGMQDMLLHSHLLLHVPVCCFSSTLTTLIVINSSACKEMLKVDI